MKPLSENTTPSTTLSGFNNLTKTLSFNIYDLCYANSQPEIEQYMNYIHGVYNADKLTQILKEVATIIDANILNISSNNYEPLGASVTMMVSEGRSDLPNSTDNSVAMPMSDLIAAHLDKSHITVHTYPEGDANNEISSFRVDIDVSTCGKISPLKALNFLIQSFDSDVVIMDYRIRGFTRNQNGTKIFADHEITSIQNFIDEDLLSAYQTIDININGENIFHTKMMLKDITLKDYLFQPSKTELHYQQRSEIKNRIQLEMSEIYFGQNIK